MALTTVPVSLSATALTLTTAAQPNITSVGTLTGLTVSGNIAGTLTTAAQPNITSTGTLNALGIAGNLTVDTNTFHVDASNNRVGIGTTNPSSPLTVHGNLRFNTTSGDGDEQRALFNVGGSGDPFSITGYKADASTVGLSLSAGGTSYFNGGSVVIGGTTVQGGGLLTLEGPDANMLVLHRTADTGDQEIIFMDHGDHNATVAGKDGGGLRLLTNGRSTTALDLASTGVATFGGRINFPEHIIGSANGGYLQVRGTGDRYWVIGSTGGNTVPTTASATLGFHHYDGSSWTQNKVNITASGKLGLGTSNPDADLHIQTGSTNVFTPSNDSWHTIVLHNNAAAATNTTGIALEVSGSGYHGNAGTGIAAVKNGTNSDYGADLAFITRPQSAVAAERMRILSTGDILMGTNTTAAGNEGVVYFAGNSLKVTRDSNEPLVLDRLTNQGKLVEFRQAGTTRGLIGTVANDLFICSGGNNSGHNGLRFHANGILPTDDTGALINDDADLGDPSYRFKDIYAGGGILLSGTAAKNRLENFEDLENVASSINLYKGSTLVSSSYNARWGYYARVGNLVFISFYFYVNTGGATASGAYRVYGFPFNFTHLTNSGYQSIPANYLTMNGTNIFNSTTGNHRWQANSTTYLELYGNYAGQNWTSGIIEFAGSGVLYIN